MKFLVTLKTLAVYDIEAESKAEAMAEAINMAKKAADNVVVTSATAEKLPEPKGK